MNDQLIFDLILFERCNMKCAHCYQHNSGAQIDWNTIKTIPATIKKCLQRELANRSISVLQIGICGGELFVDSYPDWFFDRYRELVDQINNIAAEFDITTKIEFVSNGLFENRDRVNQLLQLTNTSISISYDPVFRYNSDRQRQLAYANIQYYAQQNHLHEVSITLTKQSIDYYVKNDGLAIFKNIPIGICYYVLSTAGNEYMVPSDDDYFQFWNYCLQHNYINVRAFRDLIDSYQQKTKYAFCHCDKRIIIRNGIPSNNCVTYASDFTDLDFYTSSYITWTNIKDVRINEGANKRGCFVCSYNTFCPGICSTSILHKSIKLSDCCHAKRLFKLLLSKNLK